MNKLSIDLQIKNKPDLDGFAGFIAGTTKNKEIKIRVNINSSILACVEHDIDFYELLTANTVHELLHAFQELYKQEFDEEQVEQALEQGRIFLNEIRSNNDTDKTNNI